MFSFARARPQPLHHRLSLLEMRELLRETRSQNEAAIRGLCQNAYLGNATSLCRVLGRYKLFVDTNDLGLSSHLLLEGYWEMWLTEVIVTTVRRGMKVVDVGANLGYFSMLMADLVGAEGSVHAFEPNAAIATRLRRSVSVNGFDAQLVVHEQALGDEEGGLFRLVVPPLEPKNAYMVPADAPVEGDGELIRTRRLDAYPELADVRIIKIDADTAELAIWRGMRGILERRKPLTVFLEFNVCRYADPAAFLDEILAWGFSLSVIDLARGPLMVSPSEVLADNGAEDLMLMLVR